MLAAVFAEPFALLGKELSSTLGFWSDSEALRLWDCSAMYVSMHFAMRSNVSQKRSEHKGAHPLTYYSIFKLAGVIYVEKLPSTQCEYHAFIVLLKVVVDLRSDESSKLPLRKRFILVESLSVMVFGQQC